MKASTPLEGALLVLRKLDTLEHRLGSLEQGMEGMVTLLTRISQQLEAHTKTAEVPIASYVDLYGDEREEESSIQENNELTTEQAVSVPALPQPGKWRQLFHRRKNP